MADLTRRAFCATLCGVWTPSSAHTQRPVVHGLSREGEADVLPRRYVLTSGTLTVVSPDGTPYFAVGELVLVPPPHGVPALRLREEVGQKGQLVWERSSSR